MISALGTLSYFIMAFGKGINLQEKKTKQKIGFIFSWITQKLYFTKLHAIVSVDWSAIISELQKYCFQVPKADICDEGWRAKRVITKSYCTPYYHNIRFIMLVLSWLGRKISVPRY